MKYKFATLIFESKNIDRQSVNSSICLVFLTLWAETARFKNDSGVAPITFDNFSAQTE